ncbi:MAG: hypothetical protein AAFU84_20165 [Cyanobacteria bacterium J06633_23]
MAMDYPLWDLAGVDGLAAARYLFGPEVDYLAPFQSMETLLQEKNCSVLRLCDRNFRIVYAGPLQQLITPLKAKIWLKQFDWLARLSLPISLLPEIVSQATVRPPHRLKNIPNHRAVPAQLQGIPLLIWQHPHQGQAILELHAARQDLKTLASKLEQIRSL